MKELNDDARTLIERASRYDGPSPDDRARVRRALVTAIGAGAALTSSTTAAGASAAAGATVATGGASIASLLGWMVVGAGVGLATALPVAMLIDPPARASGARVEATAQPPKPAEPRAATKPEGPGLQPDERSEKPAALDPPAPGVRNRAIRPAPSALVEARADDLARESRLLSEAQRELAAGRPQAALAALEHHETTFPRGALTPEREAARVLAACAAGHRLQARQLAQQFMAAHPTSPLRARVDAACR
jgi:hypothetical protein